jgi:hypothetical protein
MSITAARKRTSLVLGVASVVGMTMLGASPSQAAVLNGDFSSGFSGWETLGNTNASSGAAVLTAGGSDTSSIESFLGLASGTLSGIGTSPNGGSAIKQLFFATAGTVVSFDWLFEANDYLPFNDFSFVSLVPNGANLLSNVAIVGDYGSSGLQSFSSTIGVTGNYTLGFGVLNATDNILNSSLTIDNVSVTPVPTPALLPGLIGLGVGVLRKRKGNAAEQATEA